MRCELGDEVNRRVDVVSIFKTALSPACGHLKARLPGREWQELPSLHRHFLPEKPLQIRIQRPLDPRGCTFQGGN